MMKACLPKPNDAANNADSPISKSRQPPSAFSSSTKGVFLRSDSWQCRNSRNRGRKLRASHSNCEFLIRPRVLGNVVSPRQETGIVRGSQTAPRSETCRQYKRRANGAQFVHNYRMELRFVPLTGAGQKPAEDREACRRALRRTWLPPQKFDLHRAATSCRRHSGTPLPDGSSDPQ